MYNVIEYLEESAKLHKNKIAIIEEDKSITYKDFNDYSKKGPRPWCGRRGLCGSRHCSSCRPSR